MYYAPYPYPLYPNAQSSVYYLPNSPIPGEYFMQPFLQNYPRYRQQQNQYPPVNIQLLDKSARKFQALMKQADLLIEKIINSSSFARELMTAAQLSDQNRVDQLIKSTGITIDVTTTFTPSGIHIVLDNSDSEGDCCKMLIALRW